MTGINIKIKLTIIVAVIVISAITRCSSTISDRRLCYDRKCSEPISVASTLIKYNSIHPGILSFDSNTEVIVFSKSAGKRLDLWGVEINGKRGYIPMNLIKEKKVMRKLLTHELPTEEIDANSDTIAEAKDVPKDAEIAAKPINAQETLNTDGIIEKANFQTIPEPSQPMPSFEIHDGTTINLAGNEEPQEPSYSTAIPKPIINMEEQPILSIHPNIASSVTLKTHQAEISIEDDAEKYLKNAGLRDDLSSKKIVSEELNDKPDEPVLLDLNYAKQTEATDLPESHNISEETKKIREDDAVETSMEFTVSSSQEQKSETKKINEDASTTESSDRPANITTSVTEKSEKQSDNLSNDGIENEVAEKEKTSGKSVEKSLIEEKIQISPMEKLLSKEEIQSSPMEKLLSKEEIQNSPIEGTTESPTSESLEKKDEIEKINTNDKQDDKRVVEDPKDFSEESEKTENATENVTLVADMEKSSAVEAKEIEETENPVKTMEDVTLVAGEKKSSLIDLEETKGQQAQNNLSNDGGEPENMNTTEENIPIEKKEDLIENSVEMKTSEGVLPNINLMNPLFNRLSMLPSLVKEVVGNAISSDLSEEKSTSDEKIDNAETKISNDETVIDESSSKNIDNSVPAEIPESDTTTGPEGTESNQNKFVNSDINNNNNNIDSEKNENESTADTSDVQKDEEFSNKEPEQPGISKEDELSGFGRENVALDETSSFNGFPANRNLLNVGSGLQPDEHKSAVDTPTVFKIAMSTEFSDQKSDNELITESSNEHVSEMPDVHASILEGDEDMARETADSCLLDSCQKPEGIDEHQSSVREDINVEEEIDIIDIISIGRNYWETLTYVVVTAFTTLIFSLGYYYIENTRRDGQLIAKINKLEKELLVCTKECTVLDDSLKSTKTKLDSIEDESFGSNEMVASLKADLEASQNAKSELEDQVAMLEKELESATEAGLGLERMLREILSTNNEDNPLAQSVEDLQTRLNAQQAANEALTNALNLKAQENETLTSELKAMTQKCEQLEVELTRITEELKHQNNAKSNLEHTLLEAAENFKKQLKEISAERINLRKQLKGKEMEMKDLLEVVNQMNINNFDFEKLYNVSQIKAEAGQLLEERDELKIRLSEVEGAHQLLEEHAKLINEEVSSLSEQCKLAEKAKRDAETKVEVLSNFFKEKEAQRQKEEAVWLQKQGEVSSTVERLHTMQNEIHNYKQQIEILKREILDQEREYKSQIASLETKSHEQWVVARQNERRLEESKVEAGQLRNRLTLIEKNLNDADPDAKLHRLEANGDTATSPQLFIGAEASSSPIMFTGSSGIPLPPPPSYLYGPPVPPFMPPPPHGSSGISSYEVGQRPPPLGGRLSSPPPLHGTNSGRYDNPRSPPPPLSPSMLPPFGHHRGYPPPFPNERIHPPPPPHSAILPPWADETLRNSGFQPHQKQQQQQQPSHHRDQQKSRNHKGSLHSSGESLDKNL